MWNIGGATKSCVRILRVFCVRKRCGNCVNFRLLGGDLDDRFHGGENLIRQVAFDLMPSP
jgi:hypothetical protein